MFTKQIAWLKQNTTYILLLAIVAILIAVIMNLIDVVRKPPVEKDYGDVRQHLVWDMKGACYFVKPFADPNVTLIRLSDCDKK